MSEAPGLVRGIQEVDPELVADQVHIDLEHFSVSAVKTGMLYSPAIVRAVHEVLAGTGIPVVVDPVMIATAGDRLMREEAVAVYEELLLPGAALLTPNLDEAAVLLRSSVNPERDELPEAAARLAIRYGCPVLLKGGHLEGDCPGQYYAGPDGRMLAGMEPPARAGCEHAWNGLFPVRRHRGAAGRRGRTGHGGGARPGIHCRRHPGPPALGASGPGGCAEIVVGSPFVPPRLPPFPFSRPGWKKRGLPPSSVP